MISSLEEIGSNGEDGNECCVTSAGDLSNQMFWEYRSTMMGLLLWSGRGREMGECAQLRNTSNEDYRRWSLFKQGL